MVKIPPRAAQSYDLMSLIVVVIMVIMWFRPHISVAKTYYDSSPCCYPTEICWTDLLCLCTYNKWNPSSSSCWKLHLRKVWSPECDQLKAGYMRRGGGKLNVLLSSPLLSHERSFQVIKSVCGELYFTVSVCLCCRSFSVSRLVFRLPLNLPVLHNLCSLNPRL